VVGTWWMGQDEEPLELDLTYARRDLVGHVTLWGYLRSGSSGAAAALVGPPVIGTVAARVLVLSPDIEPRLVRLLGGLLGLPVLDEDP
jgi:hypothetical protein